MSITACHEPSKPMLTLIVDVQDEPLSPYTQTFASYVQLGGRRVELDEVHDELSRHNLDGVLGFLGSLAMDALREGLAFYQPPYQVPLLALAAADSFPERLPDSRRGAAGGNKVLVHSQNLAWLAHQALLHTNRSGFTPSFDHAYRKRMLRLLLLANDQLDKNDAGRAGASLIARKHLVLDFLRQWQFSQSFDLDRFTRSLIRHRSLLLERLPRYFDVGGAFQRVTDIDLEVYLAVVLAIVYHFLTPQLEKATGKPLSGGMHEHWLAKPLFFNALEAHRDEAETILGWWCTTPEAYEERWRTWQAAKPSARSNLDFVQLRRTPLVEARHNELVCPVVHFLLQKIIDEPFFILSGGLPADERTGFQNALGHAYNDYANDLLALIAANDRQGAWTFAANPQGVRGGEVADALLRRGATGVAFEHKALRPSTDFYLGIDGDRVLGPPDAVLEQLEVDKRTAQETKNLDKGLLTRAMNQQTRAAEGLQRYARDNFGAPFHKVYPVICHLADVHVDRSIYEVYLERLIKRNQLYLEPFWQQPQWFHVEVLEYLVRWAEMGKLDLEALLESKVQSRPHERFDVYLADYINSAGGLPKDGRTYAGLMRALEEAGRLLYPKSSSVEL